MNETARRIPATAKAKRSDETARRLLIALFSMLAMLAVAAQAWAGPDARGRIGVDEARDLSASGETTIVDVRTPGEWRQTGLAAGALPITMHDPGGPRAFLANVLDALNGDRDAPVALICATGVRSAAMRRFLTAQGFTRVYDITEGMLGRSRAEPGWIASGLPTQPCDC